MIFSKNKGENNDNFWIAYADLMAGLLFIFILLIGAIVVKYVLAQNSLEISKQKLVAKEAKIAQNELLLSKKEDILQELMNRLNQVSNTLDESEQSKHDLEENITAFRQKTKDLNVSVSKKDMQILELLQEITKKDKTILLKDEQLKALGDKIKALGVLQSKVVGQLQKKLGSGFLLNASNGAISLPSSVLFDKDSYILKPQIKEKLRLILKKYFNAILNNPKILANIQNIVIEGHTDSDGSYIYNLDLSQKRAYEVMNFIYTFYKDVRLQKLLIASGRSYSQLIFKNGKEDKEASRRIEIKFNISLENAIKKLEVNLNDD